MSEPTTRCTLCAAEFSAAEIQAANACPACGDVGTPCAIAHDVDLRINWHELRILFIWAEHWARQMQERESKSEPLNLVRAIAARVELSRPDGAPPLTFADEIRELATATGRDVTVERDGQREVVKPERKQ